MIDAAVNGGTQKYIEAFLSEDFLKENPGQHSVQCQQQLKNALRDQITQLRRGLDVFGKRCDAKLKGLYDHLSAFFDQMVAKTQSVLA